MYTKWTEHLQDQKDKEHFRNRVIGSKDVFERLTQILDEKERDLNLKEVSIETYNQPNWAERQAHHNGYRSCLHALRKLIDLDKQIIQLTQGDKNDREFI